MGNIRNMSFVYPLATLLASATPAFAGSSNPDDAPAPPNNRKVSSVPSITASQAAAIKIDTIWAGLNAIMTFSGAAGEASEAASTISQEISNMIGSSKTGISFGTPSTPITANQQAAALAAMTPEEVGLYVDAMNKKLYGDKN